MIELNKLFVIFLIVIIVYIEPYFKTNQNVDETEDLETITGRHSQYKNILTNSSTVHTQRKLFRHRRSNIEEKSGAFYFSNRDRLMKKYPELFEQLQTKLLINMCPHSVKLSDTERLGECLMEAIEAEVHQVYQRERVRLEEKFDLGKLPSMIYKMNPDMTRGMAIGDVPIFHKLLKFRYFKKFDEFHLDFFHYLPLILKNEIRHYFMFKSKNGYDVITHERIHYLEEKVDEWILRCANYTRMGSLGQDAFYEEEFLHDLSPEVGDPHLLYEVTEMNFKQTPDLNNFTIWEFDSGITKGLEE